MTSKYEEESNLTLTSSLKNFYEKQIFVENFTIGKDCYQFSIRAHCVVLCSFSERFLEAFSGGEKTWKTDFFTAENKWTLEPIIKFMYYGLIDLSLGNVIDILRSAYYLKIKNLVDRCLEFMENQFNGDCVKLWLNALNDLLVLDNYGSEYLKKTIDVFTNIITQDLNILAYNCRGLKRLLKNDLFFEFISRFEIIILIETFRDDPTQTTLDEYFKNYTIDCIPATRKQKQGGTMAAGRASGGILCAVRSDLKEFIKLKTINQRLVIEIFNSVKNYYIVPVYWNSNIGTELEKLHQFLTDNGFQNIMLLGDFNARIGNHQNNEKLLIEYDGTLESIRKSLDVTTNDYGHEVKELIVKNSFVLLNGSTKGDLRGEFTCLSHKWLIDYCAIRGEWTGVFNDFEILNRDFLQRFPLSVTLTINSKKLNVLFFFYSYSFNSLRNSDFVRTISDFDVIISSGTPLHEARRAYFEDYYIKIYENVFFCAVKNIWKEFVQIEKINSKFLIKITQGNATYYIVPVNLSEIDWDKEFQELKELILELLKTDKRNIMLLGGFSARIGDFQNTNQLLAECCGIAETTRMSFDKKLNKNGKQILEMFKEYEFLVLNGITRGDVKGDFTSMSKSVIDYCFIRGNWSSMIKDLSVVKDVDFSDHYPLLINLKNPLSI